MLSIVIPTYNESKNIENLIKKIGDSLSDGVEYEILICDDNSPDGTAQIAKKLSDKYPIRVIIRYKDRGLAPAVIEGFHNAKGDIIAVMDADLSHPPEILTKLFKAVLNGAEVAVASRLIQGGGTEDWPRTRKLTSYIATLLAKPLTKIKDPMSGFFMLKKSVIDGVRLHTKGYKILLDILAKGNYKTAVEVPFTFRDRTAGESKLNLKVNYLYFKQVLGLYLYKLKKGLGFKTL